MLARQKVVHTVSHFDRDTKLHSFQWVWEDGVKLLPNQQCTEDDSKLSKADVMEYLHRLMPNR